MSEVPHCLGCGKEQTQYQKYHSARYAPKLCWKCFSSGVRVATAPRIISPWMIDAQGNRCRTVEGGA